MDDVYRSARSPADRQEQGDGCILGGRRSRREVRGVLTPLGRPRGWQIRERPIDGVGQFGVGEERCTQAPEDWHGAFELRATDVSEFRHAGRYEERFETEDPLAPERGQLGFVARHNAAPEADVDMTSGGCRLALGGQRYDRGRGRHAVERHVDEGRDASCRGCARPRLETLPVGAPRLVQVHVRIDEAWHDDVFARVDQSCIGWDCVVGRDGSDTLAVDLYTGRGEPAWQRHTMTTPDQGI